MGYSMQSIKILLEIKLLLKTVRLSDSCTHTVKFRQHRDLILPSFSGSVFPTAGSFLMWSSEHVSVLAIRSHFCYSEVNFMMCTLPKPFTFVELQLNMSMYKCTYSSTASLFSSKKIQSWLQKKEDSLCIGFSWYNMLAHYRCFKCMHRKIYRKKIDRFISTLKT